MQAPIICIDCKYYKGGLRCAAFPEGFPDEIISGESDHSEIIKGQEEDIVYTKE